MVSASNPNAADRLSRGQVVRYAIGSLGTGGFATLPGLVLVYYLTDSLGVAALAAGLIVTAAKVWDVLIDPIIGRLSDRAATRSGTRRALMVIGSIGLPIAFVLTFAVPAGLGPSPAAIWVLIAFVLAATCFSLFQVPYIALPAELTDSYRERTRLLSWRVVVLTVAILLFGAGGPEIRGLFPQDPLTGYFVMALVAGVVIGCGMFVAATVAGRPQAVSTNAPHASHSGSTLKDTVSAYRRAIGVLRDSQPFRALLLTYMLQGLATGLMLAAAQYVARWTLGDEGAVTPLFLALIAPAAIAAPVWKRVADRLGKERSFRLATLLFLLASVILIGMVWAPGWWILAPVALAGTAYAGMQTLPMAMLPDIIAVDSATNNSEGRAGIFSGVWTAGETTGMALGATVLSIVLAATGYIESVAGAQTQSQPGSALLGIALAFSALPALLMLVSLVSLGRYRLRERDIAALNRGGER